MITVITGAAVAFFQSTRVERFVSRNYADLARAQLAADAAAAAAQALVTSLFTNYPDSATAWTLMADVGSASSQGFTTFYFRTTDTNGLRSDGANAATPASLPVFLFAHPLASGGNAVQKSAYAAASAFNNTNTPGNAPGLSPQNSVDLNADNWIGTPPGGSRPVLRGKWVELLQNPTQPKNTNRNAAGQPINPVIARYAFWAEDESFRVNLNVADARPRTTNQGTNPSDIVLQGAITNTSPDALATGIAGMKTLFRSNLPTPGFISFASGADTNTFETNKFVISTHSSALNFSRGGTLRLNLNQVVTNTNDPTIVRNGLDRIIAAITNQSGTNVTNSSQRTAGMPLFGQRAYRAPPFNSNSANDTIVPPQQSLTYLQRIAANIWDYMDLDSQPTIVNSDSTIRQDKGIVKAAVNETNTAPSDILAFGKEPLPLLTEYGLRVVKTRWDPVGTGADFEFFVYHYFEFWNPTTVEIPVRNSAPPTAENPGSPLADASIQVYNMYNFDAGNTGTRFLQVGTNPVVNHPAPPPALFLALTNFRGLVSFPPNSFTVLTTDPNPSSVSPAAVTYIEPNNFIRYFGRASTNLILAQVGSGFSRAGSASTDYDLRIKLYNSTGLLDSFSALATVPNVGAPPLRIDQAFGQDVMYCSLRGNVSGSYSGRSGDPRSLNEQQFVLKYVPNAQDLDQTRFYNSSFNSFGTLIGSTPFVFPTNWSDWSPANPTGPSQAPYRHLNSNLITIGSLGDVYDPAFVSDTNSSEVILRKRGGGRTLKIGQSDLLNPSLNPNAVWDGTETNASRNWTSWRLADVFSVTNAVTQPGLININGALRDNGLSLRATALGLIYDQPPAGAQQTAGRALNVSGFVSAVRTNLAGTFVGSQPDTNPGNDLIFWERGQLGELADAVGRPLFSSPVNNSIAGVSLATAQDRGREELVRRLMELICTRGNTYTIYAIGQSLDPRTGRPVATQRLKRTFRIDPVFNPPLPDDGGFSASSSGTGGATDRFRRPSSFSVTTLHTTSQ